MFLYVFGNEIQNMEILQRAQAYTYLLSIDNREDVNYLHIHATNILHCIYTCYKRKPVKSA